jgi:hypothetical protein
MDRHRCACSHPLPEMHHRQAAQNGQIWIARVLIGTKPMSPQNGGSARLSEISFVSLATLSSPGHGPTDDQPSRIFIHRRARGERPQLPRTGSSIVGRQDLGRTTWSVDLVRVGADGSLHWLRVWPTPEEHTRHAGLELWMAVHGYQIVSKLATWFDRCPDEGD